MFLSVLTIIELQNDIWDHQKKAANETTGDQRKGQSVLNANVTIQSDIIWQIKSQKIKCNLIKDYFFVLELQNRVDGLISEIDDKDDENTKLSE